MKRNDRVYLTHILEAISKIDRYTKNLDYAAFLTDDLVQDGVIRQLEIIGEASKKLSAATRTLAPDLPWKDIAGMRDVLIHQYFGVDLTAVWDTVQQDLPIFKDKILKVINSLPSA